VALKNWRSEGNTLVLLEVIKLFGAGEPIHMVNWDWVTPFRINIFRKRSTFNFHRNSAAHRQPNLLPSHPPRRQLWYRSLDHPKFLLRPHQSPHENRHQSRRESPRLNPQERPLDNQLHHQPIPRLAEHFQFQFRRVPLLTYWSRQQISQ